MTIKFAISGAAAIRIIFLLRFVQQSALVLTGFVSAYFIYWHNALRDPVPLPLIGLLTAVLPPLFSIARLQLTINPDHTLLPRKPHLLRPLPPHHKAKLPTTPQNQHTMLRLSWSRVLRVTADGIRESVV